MSSEGNVEILLGNQRRGLIALAVPLGIALLIQHVNSFVDTLWVSGLGSDHMAAVGIISPVYVAIVGVGNGLGIGISAAISRYIGKGDHASANRMAAQGLMIAAAVALGSTAVLLVTAEPVLRMFGAGEILPLCMDYAIPIYAGTTFIMLSGVMSGMLRGEGAAKRSMYIQTAGAIVNIILDPILIYTFGMGVTGAAWATVIALAVSSAIPFYWYLIKKDTFVMIRRSDFVMDRSARYDILSVGLPEMLELSLMSLFNVVLNYFVIMCGGTDGVAIFTTSWKVVSICLVVPQAIGGALVSVCSAEYGMRRFDSIKDAYRYSITVTLAAMVVISLTAAILSGPIATLFTLGENTIQLRSGLQQLLLCMCVLMPFFSLVYPSSSLMQALRKAGQAMVNTILRNFLIIALFAAVAFTTADLRWIWYMLIVSESIGGLMMLSNAVIVLKDTLRKESKRAAV